MEERLKYIINKIILPRYPSIVKFAVEPEEKKEMKYNFVFDRPIYKTLKNYNIIYKFETYSAMKNDFLKVTQDTEAFFDMLGPEDDESIEINAIWNVL